MAMPDQTLAASAVEDFESAKVIAEKLKDVPRDRQERVLRWVADSLGIASPVAKAAPASASPAEQTHTPPPAPPIPPAPPGSPSPHVKDIRSFVEEKEPQTDIQFVTVVAYYYRFIAPTDQRRTTIDAEFSQEAARLAQHVLINAKSTLNNAKRQGYLNSRERGQFEITTVGENLVVRGLPAAADAPKGRRASARKRNARKHAAGRKRSTRKSTSGKKR